MVFIDGSGNETLASADVFDPNTINGHVPQVATGDYTVEVRSSPTDPPVFSDPLFFDVT